MTLADRVLAVVAETLPQAVAAGVLDMRALRVRLAPKLRAAAKELGLPDGDPTQAAMFAGEEKRDGTACVDGADFDKRDEEIAALRGRLDCGADRNSAEPCRLTRPVGEPGDVCAECMIRGIGQAGERALAKVREDVDGERAARARAFAGLENHISVLTAERDRLILAADAPPAKPVDIRRAAPRERNGQAALSFEAPAPVADPTPYVLPSYLGREPKIAKATLPARPCGCGGKGAHRATCKLHKIPVRKARLHLHPPGAS